MLAGLYIEDVIIIVTVYIALMSLVTSVRIVKVRTVTVLAAH